MSVRSTHLKLIGAAGAAALTVAAFGAPAVALGPVASASVPYTCGGIASATGDYNINTAIPTTMVAGQIAKLDTSAQFTLDKNTTDLAKGTLGWTKVDGTITATPGARLGLNIAIDRTTLGNNLDGSTTANASGKTIIRPVTAGTVTLKFGDLKKVHLVGYDASDNQVGFFDFPSNDGNVSGCVDNDGSTTLQNIVPPGDATVSVSKDKSKTTTTAKYVAKKHQALGTAKVKGATYGLAGTGKVKFILKKGTKTIASKSGSLNKKGIASTVFKNVTKKGKYSITAKFGGDKALKSSSGKDTFSV
jgi:hypothetical protein